MSLIQQALKRQQDEAKGKIVLPPPHLGSTQLAVKPAAPVKPPLLMPAPPIAAPEHSGEDQQRLKLIQTPPPVAPVPTASLPLPEPPLIASHVNVLKLSQPPVAAEPAPVSIEPPVREESSGLKSARILIVLLLVAVAVYWFWWRPKTSAQATATRTESNAAAAGAAQSAPPAPGLTEGQPVVKNSGFLPDVKDIKSKVDAMQTAVAAANAQSAEIEKGIAPVPTPVAPAPVAPAPVAPVVAVAAPVAPVVAPVAAKPPPASNLVWPSITVNGVMPHAVPSKASAIINGNVVSVGEEIDDMKVIEVRERGVLMEMKGEQKLYGIGRR